MSKGTGAPYQDLSSGQAIAIAGPHYMTHNGEHYELKDVVDQSLNAVLDIQITTPDTKKWAHMAISFDSEKECEWFLYRNVVIETAGDAANVQNANHNSAKTSGLVVKQIENSSLSNANADTTVAAATEIHHGRIGAGQKGGEHDHNNEIIMKQDEDYTLRFIATVAGYINFHLDWYEKENEGGDF